MTAEHAKMAEESHRYFLQNEKELRLKYPGRYVAIADNKVVESSESHKKLLNKLQSTDYDTEEVFVKQVREKGEKVVR